MTQGFGKARIIPNVRREKNPIPRNRFFWNAPRDLEALFNNLPVRFVSWPVPISIVPVEQRVKGLVVEQRFDRQLKVRVPLQVVADVTILDHFRSFDAEPEFTPVVDERFVDSEHIDKGPLSASVNRKHVANLVSEPVPSTLLVDQVFPKLLFPHLVLHSLALLC